MQHAIIKPVKQKEVSRCHHLIRARGFELYYQENMILANTYSVNDLLSPTTKFLIKPVVYFSVPIILSTDRYLSWQSIYLE